MHRLGVERRRRGTVGREARGGREICSLRRVRDDAYELAPLYATPNFDSVPGPPLPVRHPLARALCACTFQSQRCYTAIALPTPFLSIAFCRVHA